MALDDDVDNEIVNANREVDKVDNTRASGKARAVLYASMAAYLISAIYDAIKFDHNEEVSPFYMPSSIDPITQNIIITTTIIGLLELYARKYKPFFEFAKQSGAHFINITPNTAFYSVGGLYGVFTAINVITNFV